MSYEIVFYPAKGERNSPVDLLLTLCDKNDQANISQKLSLLGDTNRSLWKTFKWLKVVEKMYQLRQGNFRVYLQLYEDSIIVVSHFCRKFGQTAKKKDKNRARENFEAYVRERNNEG